MSLSNMYGIIAVNPRRHKHVKYKDVDKLINWLISPKGQKLIDEFRVKGKRLFHPVVLGSANGF